MDQASLKSTLKYYPESGEFYWIKYRNGVNLGNRAGCLNRLGYSVIRVDGKLYTAHRLAFLYMTGDWPAGVIDHINGFRDDNRWDNLRDVTKSANAQNSSKARNYYFSNKEKKYKVEVVLNGRKHSGGYFSEEARAKEAAKELKKKLHVDFMQSKGILVG